MGKIWYSSIPPTVKGWDLQNTLTCSAAFSNFSVLQYHLENLLKDKIDRLHLQGFWYSGWVGTTFRTTDLKHYSVSTPFLSVECDSFWCGGIRGLTYQLLYRVLNVYFINWEFVKNANSGAGTQQSILTRFWCTLTFENHRSTRCWKLVDKHLLMSGKT